MSTEQEVTKLEYVSKAANQTYAADCITIVLCTLGYNIDPKIGKVEDRRNTILSININSKSEPLEHNQSNSSPSQHLRLDFQYHYGTPFGDHDSWVYDLTLGQHNSERKARHLDPDFFRVTQDDQWIIVEWLSYTRKETYGGSSTSDSPDDLIACLAIPTSQVVSLRVVRDHRY
jgi:hypothetical protein